MGTDFPNGSDGAALRRIASEDDAWTVLNTIGSLNAVPDGDPLDKPLSRTLGGWLELASHCAWFSTC